MANMVYTINKGINASIEFKGLKAQYIWYLGGGIAILMIIFSALYFMGIPSLGCMGIVGVAGSGLVFKIYAMSKKYGEHGLMKTLARKQVPKAIRINSRKVFLMDAKHGK